ncbi:tyrosine-type recombinase/integrase [Microvirga sp. 2TAF3]|uniref:tyrosine-type recombinase/integrase n=1 Tax=Microvirga sp. 2TAF3 TaxID=3233014 RepID=UPI003F9E4D1E
MTNKTCTGYTRKRLRLRKKDLNRARNIIARGKVPGRGLEWADEGCQGLALRITQQAATWYFRHRARTVRLGTIDILTVPAAREAAARTKLQLKDGRDPRPDLRVYENALATYDGNVQIASDAAWPVFDSEPSNDERRRRGPWLWSNLRDEFLAVKKESLSERYFPAYERYLWHPAFDEIASRIVSTLTIDDLEQVRDSILETSTPSAAKRSVDQMRNALTWAWKQKGRLSGLNKAQYPWWARLAVDYHSNKRQHTPTIEELARTLVLAESYRTLGETEHATGPGTLAMLWALVLTAQRTFPLSQTETAKVVPWDSTNHAGWWLVEWASGVMKSGLPHTLPIPPEVKATIDNILAEDIERHGPSKWLFPSKRGDDDPVSKNSVNQLLNRLGGIRNGSNKGTERGDLLALYGIRRWVPHDVRRTLATFLEDHMLGGSASAILDHTMNKEEDERQKTAEVTRLHYSHAQRLELKALGMELWCKGILDAYRREKAAWQRVEA